MRATAERDTGLRPGTARLPRDGWTRSWVPAATPSLPSPHPLPAAQRRHSARCLPAPKTRGPFVSICCAGLNGDIVTTGPPRLAPPLPLHRHRQPPARLGPASRHPRQREHAAGRAGGDGRPSAVAPSSPRPPSSSSRGRQLTARLSPSVAGAHLGVGSAGARPFSLSPVPPAAPGLWGSPGTPRVEESWGGI